MKQIFFSDSHAFTTAMIPVAAQLAKEVKAKSIIHGGDLVDGKYHAQKSLEFQNQMLQTASDDEKNLIQRINQASDPQLVIENLTANERIILDSFAKKNETIINNITEIIAEDLTKINNAALNAKTKFGVDFFYIKGNHDSIITDQVLTNMTNLEGKVTSIDGIKYGGIVGSDEIILSFPKQYIQLLFPHLLEENLRSKDALDIQKKLGTRSLDETIFKLSQEHDFKPSKTYSSLKNKAYDVLISHKGPTEDSAVYGSSAYSKALSNDKKFYLCGHIHSPTETYTDEGLLGYRANPGEFLVLDINERTKKINYIDVYKFKPSKTAD